MGVSIIIPAYNSEKYLASTIQSVLGQTRQDWEIVIVNDGSTDQTGFMAETFARREHRIRVVHQKNGGTAQARNRGFAETREDYEYCMLLDHDDVLEPDALEILLNALQINADAVAAHGLRRWIDREGRPLAINGWYAWPGRRRGIQGHRLKLYPVSAPTTFAVLAYGDCIPTSGIIMRRTPKNVVGDFDPNAGPCDDWDMWLRLSRLGDIAFVNRVIYAWRIHQGNASKNRQRMWEGELYVQKKMYRSADLNEHEKSIILIGYRYHELYRARIFFLNAARNFLRRRWSDAFSQLGAAIRLVKRSLKGDL